MKALITAWRIRHRNLFRTIFGFFSLSGMLFIFQACYGTPQDFGQDVMVEGKVISSLTGAGIQGIKVSVEGIPQYTSSGSDGSFVMFLERLSDYRFTLTDTDGETNGLFQGRDTLISLPASEDQISFTIALN